MQKLLWETVARHDLMLSWVVLKGLIPEQFLNMVQFASLDGTHSSALVAGTICLGVIGAHRSPNLVFLVRFEAFALAMLFCYSSQHGPRLKLV